MNPLRPNAALALLLVVAFAPAALGEEPVPLGPCLGETQRHDANQSATNLVDYLGNRPLLSYLDPDSQESPDWGRVTIPGDVVVQAPTYLVKTHLVVCGDVLVLPGASLTLYGSTLRVDHPSRDGTLLVRGLEATADRVLNVGGLALRTLDAAREDPVVGGLVGRLLFAGADRPSIVEGGLRPVVVQVRDGGVFEMRDAIVRNTRGVEVSSARVDLVGGSLESAGRGLYLFDVEDARLEDLTVRAGQQAIYATSFDGFVARNLTLHGREGVHLANVDDVALHGLTVNASRDGLYAFNADNLTLADATVTASTGFYAASAQRVTVRDTRFTVGGTGVTLTDTSDAVVTDNRMVPSPAGGIRGVYLERTRNVTVERNDAQGFSIGLHLLTGEATEATCNVLRENLRGVYVSTTVDVRFARNDLAANAHKALHAFLSPAVDARDNWWGQPEGPLPGQVFLGTESAVASDPWAIAPPDCPRPVLDLAPPTVTLVRPEPGVVYLFDEETLLSGIPGSALALGALTLRAVAEDDQGVAHVEFRVDGTLKAVDAEAPYEYTYAPNLGFAGPRVFRATAYDAAGNAAFDERHVVFHAGLGPLNGGL